MHKTGQVQSAYLGYEFADHIWIVFFSSITQDSVMLTPWKFIIGPENIPSQKESSLPTIIFSGAMT